jgi:hypothetical protein
MRSIGIATGEEVEGVLEIGPFEHTLCLFTSEVALDETMGKLYNFIRPNHRIKKLLTVK